MNFLSVLYAKAGITVDGVTTLNNTATGQTPATNDNSTKLATTAYVKNQNYYPYPTGTTAQYVRGDGSLATFSQGGGGGGSSVNYYLNGSVSQGTIGGNTYYEMSKTAIIGTNADFSINADGYVAQFVTDAGDPALLNIPGGNWNFEMFFSASSGGGSPSFYVELYKYDGTTLTLIASGSAAPESITGGTATDLYVTALAVPTTTLTLTDRLAIRVYVTHSGRTITLHTQNGHLCQVITTFTTGLTALNGLTAQVQNFAVGAGGSDFNISSVVDTHTFNLPTASATKRGALSSIDWSAFDAKVDFGDLSATAPLNYNGSGLFTIAQSSASTNGYLSSTDWTTFNAKQNAITLTTTGTSGAATLVGATLNIPQYQAVLTNPITGSLTSGYLPKATGSTTLGNSLLFDNGSNVYLNASSGTYRFEANAGSSQYINARFYGSSHSLLQIESTTAGFQALLSFTSPTRTWSAGLQGDGRFNIYDNTANAERFSISSTGATTISNLAGTGSRMVIADATGILSTQAIPSGAVVSVFGRTGAVIAVSGDYTTAQVTESGNLYYLDSRARAALSFAAGSGAYNTTTGVITIPTDNNQIANGAGYITSSALGAYLPLAGGALTGNLTTNSSVGIGTATPVTALDVVGGAYTNATAKFGGTKPIYIINDDPHIGFNTYYDSGWKYGAGSSSNFAGALGCAQTTGDFTLQTSAAGGNAGNLVTLVALMTWKQNGFVGIGTNAPSAKLDVVGTIGITTASANGIIRRTSVNGSNGIQIQGNINDTVSDTNPGASIYVGGGTLTDTYEGNIILTAYGNTAGGTRNNITFNNRSGTNTTIERMRITSGGNVLIGTTTDSGYKFTIAGSGSSYSVSPHGTGIDVYSTGNIAPHFQTNYTWYTGAIGSGTFRMGLDASGNLTAGSFIGAGTGLTGTASALSIGGNAATATNISNTGTVTLATATEANSIYITQPSYSTDQPVKLLNFAWYSDVWQMGNIRSSGAGTNGFGIYLSGTEKVRIGTDGRISNLAWSTTGRNYSNEWIEFPNFSGLYSPNNSAHFRPNNGSYGSWKIEGTRNGWGGLEFGNLGNGNISLMIGNGSNVTGFHNNGYGWQILWDTGSLYVGKGTYGGSHVAVLDASNVGSYALPIGGGTLTGDLTTSGWFINSTNGYGIKNSSNGSSFYSSYGGWFINSTNNDQVSLFFYTTSTLGAETERFSIIWQYGVGTTFVNDQGASASIIINNGASYGGTLTGAWSSTGNFTATAIIKVGGTSSQFLKADGSIDSNTYASGSFLPLSGGTLTGNLVGTTATFNGNVTLFGSGVNIATVYLNSSGNQKRWELTTGNLFRLVDTGAGGLELSSYTTTNTKFYSNIFTINTALSSAAQLILKGATVDTDWYMQKADSIGFNISKNATTMYSISNSGTHTLYGSGVTGSVATFSSTGVNIGTGSANSTEAYFHVTSAVGATNVMFGTTYPIALGGNYPGIYFNMYYNGGYKIAHGTGVYGAANTYDPINGILGWLVADIAGNEGTSIAVATQLRLDRLGRVSIGTTASTSEKLYVGGTTFLGGATKISGTCSVSSLTINGALYSNISTVSGYGTLTTTNPSDIRLKEEVETLEYGLKEVMALKPVTYKWKNPQANGKRYTGLIAQDVQEIMPEYVSNVSEDSEYLGLDSYAINIVLINAIKELQAEIQILKNK